MINTTLLLEKTDLTALLERDLGQPAKRSGGWLFWHCPFHASDNSPSFGCKTSGDRRFHCFGCGKHGDAITWLMEYRRLSFKEAVQTLGGDISHSLKTVTPTAPQAREVYSPPDAAWQDRMAALVEDCEAALWGSEGARALTWLRKRGLKDDTIRRFRLGYNPEAQRKPYVDRGITIPAFIGGKLWYVKVRLPAGKPKYRLIAGSKPVALYNADDMGTGSVLLVEGEFDAMIAWQELRDVIPAITFGAASNTPDLATWGIHFLLPELVLLTFDNDDAGWEAALRMQQVIGDKAKLVPLPEGKWKDVNDFYLAGGDLWQWVNPHLNFYDPQPDDWRQWLASVGGTLRVLARRQRPVGRISGNLEIL